MARPKVALVSRDRVVDAALTVIDEGGLAALTTRALGARLGVSGSALYHHFAGMDDILDAVAKHILDTAIAPKPPTGDWRECVVDGVIAYRDALLAHPGAVSLLLRIDADPASVGYYAELFALMREAGLSDDDIITVMSAHQSLAVGSATRLTRAARSEDQPDVWSALLTNTLSETERFRTACRALLNGLIPRP